MTPTLLLDGDMLLYKACAAVEREVRWDDQNHVLVANADEAYDAFIRSIDEKKRTLGSTVYHLAFSGPGNFRVELYPAYKSGRGRKPLCYARLLERVLQEHSAKIVPGLEADDLLGIWATGGKFKDPIIVSDDKDMKTIPGRLYRLGELIENTEVSSDYFWLTQALTGDITDGYPGCPGMGPKTAEKLLVDAWTKGPREDLVTRCWPLVVQAYEAKGLTETDALLQARLARILRASDWDANERTPILWTPTLAPV
jgi:DNA polymerase-1